MAAVFAGLLAAVCIHITFPAVPAAAAWSFATGVAVVEAYLTITFLTRRQLSRQAPTTRREVTAAYLASLRQQVDTGTAPAGTVLVVDEAAQLLGGEDDLARGMRQDLARIVMLGRAQGVTVVTSDRGQP